MSKIDQAVARFNEGHNCAQAILSTFGPQLGLDHDTALKLACGFGSGMARMSETCGAVTGAFMVLGLKHGRVSAADHRARDRTYDLVRSFVAAFKRRNGTIQCRELLGCDLSTPEGRQAAEAQDLYRSICPKLVGDAAAILEAIL
jgi:C_GCAxxG_C_C family probable redox protein